MAKKLNESNVDHPAYYRGKVEAIDAIEAWGLGFSLGNAVKYIARAGKKNPDKLVEDLEKASWYLSREITRLKEEGPKAPLTQESENDLGRGASLDQIEYF